MKFRKQSVIVTLKRGHAAEFLANLHREAELAVIGRAVISIRDFQANGLIDRWT